ncbi:MAG TPA: universal stress protein [Actinomycetes bacterium]|nr:universal stress protein [Actinomycetes bacterium]
MGVYRHILVGVDGSDASAQAADMAGRLAADLDAKLTVVFVRQLPAVPVSSFGVPMNLDSYWEDQERLASTRAASILDALGVAWRLEVRTGDPAVQLELSADENGAELVVVGARGHSVAHRLLLGSVSTRLLHHARRQVLVVR